MSRLEEVNRKLEQSRTTLFWILAGVSVVAAVYSVASRLEVGRNLPSFPLLPYTIGYALFVVLVIIVPATFVKTLQNVRINWVGLCRMLTREHLANPVLWLFATGATLASPTFRGVLFSQIDGGIQNLAIPVFFVPATVIAFSVLMTPAARQNASLLNQVEKIEDIDLVKGLWVILNSIAGFAFFFGLLSPYLLGVVRPTETGLPKAFALEQGYLERITDEDVSRRQASRQHFVDGKRLAALGTTHGLEQSLKHFEQASLLSPEFGTSLAETAYAYASLARLGSAVNGQPVKEQDSYRIAVDMLNKGPRLHGENPNFGAVNAILNYYAGEHQQALASLAQARSVAEKTGFSDRVLQAMALLDPKPLARLEYLLSIRDNLPQVVTDPDLRDIYANSAELHSMIGLAYCQVGRCDLARPVLERAVRLSPDYAEAYLNLGLVVDETERQAHYSRAAKDPTFQATAKRYAALATLQWWLRAFYLLLLSYLFIGGYFIAKGGMTAGHIQLSPAGLTRTRRHRRFCFLTFVATYGAFEIAVHAWGPPASPLHAFPLLAPFF